MSRPAEALLSESIDYAGLFPPAKLDMETTVGNYARYCRGPFRWMLGRLIVPLDRLDEFRECADTWLANSHQPWQLSVLGTAASLRKDLAEIHSFNRNNTQSIKIVSLERRLSDDDDLSVLLEQSSETEVFFEVSPDDDSALTRVADVGACAKVRTGGMLPEAFPSLDQLAEFVCNCHKTGVAFKATAGLHHPLRSRQRIEPQEESLQVEMHGFLNLFLATAMLHTGAIDFPQVKELLAEADSSTLVWNDERICWRDYSLTTDQITAARQNQVRSFGSCSFDDPISDLKKINVPIEESQ